MRQTDFHMQNPQPPMNNMSATMKLLWNFFESFQEQQKYSTKWINLSVILVWGIDFDLCLSPKHSSNMFWFLSSKRGDLKQWSHKHFIAGKTSVSSIVSKKRGLGRLLVSCLNGARPELEEEPQTWESELWFGETLGSLVGVVLIKGGY